MSKSKNTTSKYRNAKNGQYVTEKYAQKHKNTTVKETDKKSRK